LWFERKEEQELVEKREGERGHCVFIRAATIRLLHSVSESLWMDGKERDRATNI